MLRCSRRILPLQPTRQSFSGRIWILHKGYCPSNSCCCIFKRSQYLLIKYNYLLPKIGQNCYMCARDRDRGLLWLTPHSNKHVQSPTSSCFLDESFHTEQVLSGAGLSPPAPGSPVNSMNDWPHHDTLGSKDFCVIYFLDAHTFNLLVRNSRDSFPLSLVYRKERL